MLHKYFFFFFYKNWFVSLLLFKQIQFARGVLLVKVTWEASGRVSGVYILHHKGKWFCDKKINFTLPSQFWHDERRGTCREPAGLASHQLVLYGTPAPHHVLGELLQISCKVASFFDM